MKIGRIWISDMLVALVCFVVGISTALFLLLTTVSRIGCANEWKHSGMRTQYGVFSGCQLEVVPGKWIPADRYHYREVAP